jgi:S-DNA-T family DNA segregation ATPase FtsK/SpoIIIE
MAELPSTTLLNIHVASSPINEDELRARATAVEQKCMEFEVGGVVQQIHPGPVVTTFEFKPEPGIKYAKITGLGDDLCLALEAESVRIDRMPGKATVGIEVPNDKRATIMLRELLESAEYSHSNFRLPLALGKDITGKIVVADLQKMPHLLSAGSTGTGKSVSINAMILSLLFHSRPDQLKMILIDPKRLELGTLSGHSASSRSRRDRTKIAQNALRWAVVEMETRYKKLAKRGVRNLDAYNDQIRQLPIPGLGLETGDLAEERDPLPYIVIVIDELADLMMTAAREVEEYITRLAQMARAVGIHLILATQRPSVDVIHGIDQGEFPGARIVPCRDKTDSRTILDSKRRRTIAGTRRHAVPAAGLGATDARPRTVHHRRRSHQGRRLSSRLRASPFTMNVSSKRRLTKAARSRKPTASWMRCIPDAVNVVLEMGKASTSALQRRLRIGYGPRRQPD